MKLRVVFHKCFYSTSFLLVILFIIPAATYAHPAANPPTKSYKLENVYLSAQFSQYGLTDFYDRQLRKDYHFNEDEFSVKIDSVLVRKRDLTPATIIKENERIVFTFANDQFSIHVVYELRPSWNFISKQLEIIAKNKTTFWVNQVQVLDQKIAKPIVSDYVPHGWWPGYSTKNYGAFLRFDDGTGLLALVQNPFLEYKREGGSYSLTYNPDMSWDKSYGAFLSDRACIGAYKLTGRQIPVNMITEWKWTGGVIPDGGVRQDEAEVQAFTNCVKQFIIDKTPRPINVHVAWCENDYQEDVSMASGREVYKRIIDQAAAVGSNYVVYTPTTSILGTHADAADSWRGEGFLWLGLGIKMRKNEWNPLTDPVPSYIQEMLDHAKKRKVKLLAYVYPGMPFQQDTSWLITTEEGGFKKQYANLGFHHFQDWLINEMIAFIEKTGIGGFSFDYTFLIYPGKSVYSQWKGWCRVMEALRKRYPDIILDGRQTYQYYGPWSWVAGSYPHPTSTDEQPQSFIPFPDLHFDRVSANRMRYANYRFRIRDYCPSELMPGYMTHQTPRFDHNQQVAFEPYRIRDWDYMGWKYSVISSISSGGLNNVIDMIPARDPEEFRNFSAEDKAFFNKWLNWTRDNKSYLANARPIMGQPVIGKTDGTSAITGNEGYVFVFNPNGRQLPANFQLDASIGLSNSRDFSLREIYPVEGKLIGKPGQGGWKYGDKVSIQMDGASCMILKIEPVNNDRNNDPMLYNIQGKATIDGDVLRLNSVTGEKGQLTDALVVLPSDKKINKVLVNEAAVDFKQQGMHITLPLQFKGEYFPQMKQVGEYNPNFSEGPYRTSFRIPQRIFDQLNERKKRWPISWTPNDYFTPWLVPQRLLLFVQLAEPSDNMELRLTINGQSIELKKAYSEIRKMTHTFIGFYADISSFVADKEYKVELRLPPMTPGQFQGLFLENIETEYTSELQTGIKNDQPIIK